MSLPSTGPEALGDRLVGPLIPVMPAFHEDGRLDLDATARWVDDMIGRGMRLFWTTYGTSHAFSLDDEEIRDLTRAVAAVTRGRALFIASSQFHWSTAATIAFTDLTASVGGDAVKVQVDWRLRPADDLVLARYAAIAAESPVPLLAYALGQGTFGASAAISGPSIGLFRRLLDIPAIVGMKNDAGDLYEQSGYQAEVRRSGRRFAVITGGSMESFLHGRRFGQVAYAAAVGMLAPELVLAFDAALRAGDEATATALVRDVEQPLWSALARHGTWASLHAALQLLGHFPDRHVRFPLRTLDVSETAEIAAALRALGLLG